MLRKFLQLFDSDKQQENAAASGNLSQLAATALLIELSRSDQHVDELETSAILSIAKNKFQLTDDNIDSFFATAETKNNEAISLYEFTDIINRSMNKTEKFELIVSMWEVAHADNTLDRYEDHLIRKVADLLYVSHSDFIRAKHQVIGE